MLSYQHAYHAGNAADVHKHALLSWALAYLAQKEKPLTYIETHAGRGLYDLAAPEAAKTGEAAGGIVRALAEGWFPPGHPYLAALARVRAAHGPTAYPGSPLLAAELLRPEDRMVLAELHPQEHAALTHAMRHRYTVIHKTDGLNLALAVTPPEPRRGLMLIDPPYEVKSDYEAVARVVPQVHAKWNVGVVMIWYPILATGAHLDMAGALETAGLARPFRHEVRFAPAKAGHGMIGSGLYVVNAPFGMGDEAGRIAKRFAP
ncbi:MAG: 23S rRNA (adenine(2030)-N(6))-methyltransferase RlmJ [Paracoccaceae bacterium]